jgi:hypothetical protein
MAAGAVNTKERAREPDSKAGGSRDSHVQSWVLPARSTRTSGLVSPTRKGGWVERRLSRGAPSNFEDVGEPGLTNYFDGQGYRPAMQQPRGPVGAHQALANQRNNAAFAASDRGPSIALRTQGRVSHAQSTIPRGPSTTPRTQGNVSHAQSTVPGVATLKIPIIDGATPTVWLGQHT